MRLRCCGMVGIVDRSIERRVIELGARIKALQDELVPLQQELRNLLEGKKGGGNATSDIKTGSLAYRVVQAADADPTATVSAQGLAERFGMPDRINTLRGTLSRLSRDGHITKVAHGEYRSQRSTKVSSGERRP